MNHVVDQEVETLDHNQHPQSCTDYFVSIATIDCKNNVVYQEAEKLYQDNQHPQSCTHFLGLTYKLKIAVLGLTYKLKIAVLKPTHNQAKFYKFQSTTCLCIRCEHREKYDQSCNVQNLLTIYP